MAKLKDVAQRAGVSPATVSYVFSEKRPIGAAVRKRVLAAADELGYKPAKYAQALRTGETKTIGLLLPNITNSFYPEIAQAVQRQANELGYAVLLSDAQGDAKLERERFAHLIDHSVDGIIWSPLFSDKPPRLPKYSGPVVCICDQASPKFDVVRSDDAAVGALVADYIGDLGHKRVGLLRGPSRIRGACIRADSFLAANNGRFTVEWDEEVPLTAELSEAAIARIGEGKVSFIVAPSDLTALAVMKQLRDSGSRVPEDVSVIGFDDVSWASMMNPGLTTVRQSSDEIGENAVDLVLSRIESPSATPSQLLIGVTLQQRGSTRTLR